jgi:putative addiction module component (TIGR02574 family)
MTRTTKAIFKKALELPLESRTDLVELLLNSILEEDLNAQKKIDKAWAAEARDRFDAYLRGEIQAHPMDEVTKTLKKRHAA